MDICATGFVSHDAGSVASANAVLLKSLLEDGNTVAFFSKPSFVDPRPVVASIPGHAAFVFKDCTNAVFDGLRRKLSPSGKGPTGLALSLLDTWSYKRGIVRAMQEFDRGDLDLWLGDWAAKRSRRPVISFVQGPPGTDARSILKHRSQIIALDGTRRYWQLSILARLRLSGGLPNFRSSDLIIVGSQWSRTCLKELYGVPFSRTRAIPYPIDLAAFQPSPKLSQPSDKLRVIWLGRFVPRKRLDLFLDGLKLAIDRGCDVSATIVGRSKLVRNYARLIQAFPYQDRLQHIDSLPRADVPAFLSHFDVMCQPSDEENFGSSVAEALACGIPAIVGKTNGTADYVCDNSIHLKDDQPETLAAALAAMEEAKKKGSLKDPSTSRAAAVKYFHPQVVAGQLEQVLVEALNHG